MKYEPRFYTGDMYPRQKAAKRDGCICYVEQHLNATGPGKRPHPDDGPTALAAWEARRIKCLSTNYSMAILPVGASLHTRSWASHYVSLCAERQGIRSGGVYVPGAGGRGNVNVSYFGGPAMLLEPCFISSKEGSEMAKSTIGQGILAGCLVDSVVAAFPEGGIVGLSVGHAGRTKPDPGAPAYGGGWEADLARAILERAAAMFSILDPIERRNPYG